MVRQSLGKKLSLFRARRKWTQAQAAEACQISHRYYQNIESAKKWPSDKVLDRILEGFGATSDDLFGFSDLRAELVEGVLNLSDIDISAAAAFVAALIKKPKT